MDIRGNRKGKGTLEIIAALAVPAVVAAILFPMFARTSRGSARKDCCANNIKECAIALQMYCADYNGRLPSSALVSHSKKWNRGDFIRFATKSGELPPAGRPTTWSQILYAHMKARDIMFCPSDPSDHTQVNSRVSYYWKLAIDKAWYGVRCRKPCRKETDFPHAADQIILYERAGFHDGFPGGLKNGVRINVVYLDTHVRSVELANCANGVITDPISLGEPMYFNFDQSKKTGPGNPPDPKVPAKYIDPTRYSDLLP